MALNIPIVHPACALVAAGLFGGLPAQAQGPCPAATDSVLQSAWHAYRTDSLPAALARFNRAHDLCPANLDAKVGMGFTLLRSGQARRADAIFGEALARSATNSDAWEGQARAALRLGDTARAVGGGRRAMSLVPSNEDLRGLLDRIAPEWDRPAARRKARPTTLQLVSRTSGTRFETRTAGGWEPFYIQGVNMGVALPGRYPSEFPTDSTLYAGWMDTLSAMNANTLRVYTVLPPAFYRALRAWNHSHPDRLLWLVHGVWTELPPGDDFNDAAWKAEFQAEMRQVVDLVHGAATISQRADHARGRYDADVSPWVLGYIIGREWEPSAVKAFASGKPAAAYEGRFLRVNRGPAMDVWMAQQCDFMLAYEFDTYHALRPIAYTNWPTLDPLIHSTEATTAEEAAWRRRSGRKSEASKLEYENDAIGLDANLVRPTRANPAGWFASYHVYPYYPDFMILDPGYRKARSPEGPSTYSGYLRDLIAHHSRIPTVISEYGVPSSRGNAHQHHQGWDHGGHDERAMAAIDARLTREIKSAGAAGAIVFAWLDEWFKKNWLVIDYEIPRDNTRLWHNVMDAEQNYGIMGMYAGAAGTSPQLGGDPERWRALRLVQSSADSGQWRPRRLRAGFDESFYYLAVELGPGRFPWRSLGIQLALDTHLPTVGQHRLPSSGVRSEAGFEFLVDLVSPDSAAIRVTPDYNRHDSRLDPASGDDFGRFSRRPAATRNRNDGRFDPLHVVTNRARFGRDGTFYPARTLDRGRLVYATEMATTLADWYFDEKAGLLELRIPWDLLNVTDPSTRTLLDDRRTTGDVGTARASDFRVGVVVYRKGKPASLVGTLPELRHGVWPLSSLVPWRWTGWTEPRFHSRLKPVYDSLRLLWRGAGPGAPSGAPAPLARPAPSD